jgi:hypothetical protein
MWVILIGARGLDRAHAIILSDITIMAFVGFDLYHTLRTGRAWGRWGTITQQKRPERYWRYVHASYVVLALCAGLLIWVVAWPESFD